MALPLSVVFATNHQLVIFYAQHGGRTDLGSTVSSILTLLECEKADKQPVH